jgi:hypothetical protein
VVITGLGLDVHRSRLYLVVPVQGSPTGWSTSATSLVLGPCTDFSDIDSDVDLPAPFFRTLRRHSVEVTPEVVEVGDQPGQSVAVVGADIIGVGAGPAERWFLVVDLADPDGTLESWLDAARRVTKVDWSARLCDHFALEPLAGDVRGEVVTSLQLDGAPSPDEVMEVALHLATRAPCTEEIQRSNDVGATPISNDRYRVVTRRSCGFVAGDPKGSEHFLEKFPVEVGNQYLLAVVLVNWQLSELNEILASVNEVWGDEPDRSESQQGFLRRRRELGRRFARLNELRGRHARLVGTGSFGPVFDSGSQARFWEEVQGALGVHRRLQEVDDALQSLGQTTETEASLNVDRLLAFFTLVIGVPSLAFTVLGVNIDRLTSDSGLSGPWVVMLLLSCLLVGLAGFLAAYGHGLDRLGRRRKRRSPPG